MMGGRTKSKQTGHSKSDTKSLPGELTPHWFAPTEPEAACPWSRVASTTGLGDTARDEVGAMRLV